MSNTLLHHQIKGLALAQCPVFSLSMQIFLLSDSLSYPQRVSYYLTLFHTGLTYYFHDIGYPIIYPIVTFAYRKVKKYPIRSSSDHPQVRLGQPPVGARQTCPTIHRAPAGARQRQTWSGAFHRSLPWGDHP